MRKAIIIIFFIVLLVASGSASEKQQEKSAVNNARQTNPVEPEKSKTDAAVKTPARPERAYQPTKARSKQRVIAAFEVGSSACMIKGKSMTMEGKVFSKGSNKNWTKQYAIYVPARYFALAAGIPNGEFLLSKETSNKLSFTLNNTTVSGFGNYMESNNDPFSEIRLYGELKTVVIDAAEIPCVSVIPFAKKFGYDVYWDEASGKVELLEGLPLKEEDYVVGPLRFDLKEKELLQLLGKPERETDANGRREWYVFKDVYYSGVELGLKSHMDKDFCIFMITLTSPQYKTRRGIAVGDNIGKVIEVYGMGYRFDKTKNTYYYQPVTDGNHYNYISFTVENEIVKQIELIDHFTD